MKVSNQVKLCITLKIFKRAFGEESKRNSLVTHVIDGLGVLFFRMGHFHYAEKFHENASKSYLALCDRNHPELIHARYNLSMVLLKEGMVEKSLNAHKEILEIRQANISKNLISLKW